MHTFIKLLYSLLIAGAISAFGLLSIYTFYQPPKYPDYPKCDYSYSSYSNDFPQYNPCADQQKNYSKAVDDYDKKSKAYQKNISYVEIPAAMLVTVVGALLFKRIKVIAEGVALGGIFISIGAITAASLGDARIPRFVAALFLLIEVIGVAYVRFSDGKTLFSRTGPPSPPPTQTPQAAI